MSYSGREFDSMTEEDQRLACLNARLFSRVEPAHKSKIVDYLQKEGAVSAMVRGRGTVQGLRGCSCNLCCLSSSSIFSHRTYINIYKYTGKIVER